MTIVYDYMQSKNKRKPILYEQDLVRKQEEKMWEKRHYYENNYKDWTKDQREKVWTEYLAEKGKFVEIFKQFCGYVIE